MSGFVRGGPRTGVTDERDDSRAVITEAVREIVEVDDSDPRIVQAVEPVVVGDIGSTTGLLVEADLGVRVAGLIDGKVPLAQLPQQALPKLSHTHQQTSPSTIWVIAHGLPFQPAAVEVVDHVGRHHYPQVVYLSDLLVQLRFGRDVRGTARLS